MGHGETDEQPLVDVELLAHIEARDEERIEREETLDDDHEANRDDWETLERVFGHREAAKRNVRIPVIREVA